MITVPLGQECYMLCFGEGRERFFFDDSSGYEAVQLLTLAVLHGCRYKLVLRGPSGSGKTLLLKGLMRAFQEAQPDKKALLLNAEDYISGLVAAIEAGTQDAYAESLGANDLLILEDVHTLAGKSGTQTELLKTLYLVSEHGGVCILSVEGIPAFSEAYATLLKDPFCRTLTLQQPGRACRAVYAADRRRRLELDISDEVMQIFVDRLPSLSKLRCAMSIHCVTNGKKSVEEIIKLLR